jgi:hypothetical protein
VNVSELIAVLSRLPGDYEVQVADGLFMSIVTEVVTDEENYGKNVVVLEGRSLE